MSRGHSQSPPVGRRDVIKVAGASSILGLSGCLGDDDTNGNGNGVTNGGEWANLSGQQATFLIDDPEPEAREFWNNVASDFEDETGAEIDYVFRAADQILEEVTQRLQADDPPELVKETDAFVYGYQQQGALRPLTEVYETIAESLGDPVEGSRVPADGEQWMIPIFTLPGLYWYRSDLSDVTPDNWENMLEYVRDVDENHDTRGIYFATGVGHHADTHHGAFVRSAGTSFVMEKNGEVVSALGEDRDTWIKLLTFMRDLHEHSPPSTDSGFGTLVNAIQNESAGSNWYIGGRPKNAARDNEREFAPEVEPFPGMPKPEWTDEGMNQVAAGGLFSFEGSNGELTDEFLEFLYQPEYITEQYFAFAVPHYVPPYPEIQQAYLAEVGEHAGSAWSEDQLETYHVEAAKNATYITRELEPYNQYADAIKGSNIIGNMVQEMLLEETNPASIVDAYDSEMNEIIQGGV